MKINVYILELCTSEWITSNMLYITSRHHKLNKNGNSANFFSCVCNSKKIKELCTSTLNRVVASVRCVSSTQVVLSAILPYQLRRILTNEKNPKRGSLLRIGTQTLNSCRSLDYAHGNESILYFNDLCMPIEKAPICKLSGSKATQTPQICHYKHAPKTSGAFLLYNTSVDLDFFC